MFCISLLKRLEMFIFVYAYNVLTPFQFQRNIIMIILMMTAATNVY